MKLATLPTDPTSGTLTLTPISEKAATFARASLSDATKKAYRADFEDFSGWCADRALPPIPASPGTVADFLADRAGTLKSSSVLRRLAAISTAHRLAELESPCSAPVVKTVVEGIKRTLGTAQDKVAPVTVDVVRQVVGMSRMDSNSLLAARDSALLLLGFSGCCRRSELVSLVVEDVVEVEEGLEVTIRRSKTDQTGKGVVKRIPYGSTPATCPIRALRAWISTAGIESGPLFRSVNRHGRISDKGLSAQSVALVVKKRVEEAGHDPKNFSGHSLRRGFATSATASGASLSSIMRQGGWKTERIVLGYIDDREAWADNAACGVGL